MVKMRQKSLHMLTNDKAKSGGAMFVCVFGLMNMQIACFRQKVQNIAQRGCK